MEKRAQAIYAIIRALFAFWKRPIAVCVNLEGCWYEFVLVRYLQIDGRCIMLEESVLGYIGHTNFEHYKRGIYCSLMLVACEYKDIDLTTSRSSSVLILCWWRRGDGGKGCELGTSAGEDSFYILWPRVRASRWKALEVEVRFPVPFMCEKESAWFEVHSGILGMIFCWNGMSKRFISFWNFTRRMGLR